MTLEKTIKDLKATLGSLKTHLTNAEKNLSIITKTDLEELDKLIEENKSGPKITARRDNLKLLREARKKETDKYENAKKSLEILLGNTENKIKSSIDALELAIKKDPSSVEGRLGNILEEINSVYVNSQYILTRYKSGQYTVIQKDLQGNKISQEDYIYKENDKNKIISKLGENATNIELARKDLDSKSKSSFSSILKSHALGTYKSETAQKNAKREERANAISNFLKQSPIPDTLPVDIAGKMFTYSHGSQASIDAGGNPAPLSADIEKFTGLSTSQITKMSAQKLSEHYKPQDTSPIADVKPDAASVVNTSPIADVKPDAASVVNTSPIADVKPDAASVVNTSSIADVKPDATPSENVSSSGDGGGAKSRGRTKKIGGGGGSKGGSSGGGGTGGSSGGGGTGSVGGSSTPGGARGIVDVRLVDITTSAIKQLDDLLVKVLGSSPIGNGGGGGGTGDMAKLADEIRKSRESSENLAKAAGARVQKKEKETAEKKAAKDKETADKKAAKDIETAAKKAEAELKKNNALEDLKLKQEKQNALDAIRADILAEKEKQKGIEAAAKKAEAELKKNNALEDIQLKKEKQNAIDAINKDIAAEKEKQKGIEAAAKEAKRKEKEEKNKLKSDRQSDPFRKRLQTIFKEGEQELSFLYAKVDSFAGWIPGFNDAILSARKKALETLREGYEAFDKKYASSGSAFKGMMASIKAMYSISPFTVIVAGLTTIGVLLGKTIFNAAQKLNTQIKEISAELGTSNRQSYEMFKNAMNAQTQFENLHASLRDVMDAQKGILGDSGILLRTNDKALSAIADNAKNIGLSVESAGAFYENLRMKGAGDTEANNVMTASLELADKRGFSPQSIVDDIAQNAEFASKYFSKINKDSKSAHRNLIETNIQVKNLGLNFQKAAKMTQHLLSFEQSITAEVEASVALGTHVDIGKARELLLQDDIAGAMTQMMNAIPGGYEGFQNMDFAERQLSANALGLEVSELERSLYLREKIKLSNSEDLELAMKHDDYLRKIAGTNDELYRTELNKVQAAERYNTSIEKLSVSFRYALAPVLEAVVPVVDLLAGAINKLANIVKSFVGGITGANSDAAIGGGGIKTPDMYQMGGGALMATVMGGQLLKMMKGPVGGKIGEVVAKARGGLDTLRGTLGTKTNPMYVVSLNSGAGGGGFDGGGSFVKGKYRSQAVLDRAQRIRNIRNANSPKPGLLKGFENNIKNLKAGNLIKDVIKTGGVTAAIFAGLDLYNRKQSGQSTAQAASGSISGLLGGLGGAAIGAAIGTFLLPGIGTILGGLVGGYYGQSSASTISDSHFDKNKSSSFTGGYGIYAGMGLNTAGSIVANNKPKATGTPVETSMVDMTPTTFKSPTNSLANISPNYGMTSSIARESVMVNRSSKSVATTAMMQKTIKDKEKTDDALIKEAQEQTKLMHEMIKRLNQPSLAFFNEEGRKQTANYVRVKSTP
jgi:hypothetical protein